LNQHVDSVGYVVCTLYSTLDPTDKSDFVNTAFGNRLEVECSLITNSGMWVDVPFNVLKFHFIFGREV